MPRHSEEPSRERAHPAAVRRPRPHRRHHPDVQRAARTSSASSVGFARPCPRRTSSWPTTTAPTAPARIADTLAAADDQVQVMHRARQGGPRGGLPRRLRLGARATGYDVVVEMDADGSHQPEQLPRLLDGAARRRPRARLPLRPGRLGGELAEVARGALAAAATSTPGSCSASRCKDATGGYRAFRADDAAHARPHRRRERRLLLPGRARAGARCRRASACARCPSSSSSASSATPRWTSGSWPRPCGGSRSGARRTRREGRRLLARARSRPTAAVGDVCALGDPRRNRRLRRRSSGSWRRGSPRSSAGRACSSPSRCSSILGAAVMRRAGFAAARSLRPVTVDGVAVHAGRSSASSRSGREVGDAGGLFVAGLLIAVPGLVTSAVGLLLLIPPLRRARRRAVSRAVRRRAEAAGLVVDQSTTTTVTGPSCARTSGARCAARSSPARWSRARWSTTTGPPQPSA